MNTKFWENRRVTVTGGTGFLGRYVVDKLQAQGAEVFAGNSQNYDLRFREAILDLLQDTHPEIIIHLAAVVGGIGANRARPADFLYENLMMGTQLMHEAYQAGVDECVAKPVGPALFLAKVKVWLRRSWTVPAETLEVVQSNDLYLDPYARQVKRASGERVRLTNLEFRLLYLLMKNPGRILESDYIVGLVWGYHGEGNSHLLKNLVYRLRRKIEPDPNHPLYLHTEPGVGYRFQ